MGICFSCLIGSDENDDNERQSLLGNHQQYADENYQEQLIKQQQRQSELNGIVSDLNNDLIDVSTFVSNTQAAENEATSQEPENEIQSPALSAAANSTSAPGTAHASPSVVPVSLSNDKSFPHLLSIDEKKKILEDSKQYADQVAPIKAPGPLYVKF
ncbi:hypothetical protein FT663_00614 [Candidozyma haemuli var. vulneris]|uniref:Uncharacterized protein n=1 Tax=Candidozyma haemuli TaxID=45357 RepID=A0A2V1ARI1_9ASCO|nr:hypothetical protein CXQ85_003397 [[Candida] haemuloni]KAF3989008.1 hypothetical protein FT662_03069 [[Candida] haemuloni var. vulneris]KAF3995236.1 hypothetical protein FT663_00614 [[Candida] haemuloni var. vulneris]PVH19551.1 hypothetical protein CXQ85_003397 [[Candida] haemuloni]